MGAEIFTYSKYSIFRLFRKPEKELLKRAIHYEGISKLILKCVFLFPRLYKIRR